MSETSVQIFYYINGARFASRRRHQVPRVGDEVRLNSVCYKVGLVVWVEDQKPDFNNHVAIELQEPKPKRKKK